MNRTPRPATFVLVMLAWVAPLLLPGCGGLFGPTFTPGTYSGDLPCTLRVVDASGSEAEENFTSVTELTFGQDGGFTINGTQLAVGEQVIRSIPTADLAFEVTKITRCWHTVTVEYAPRPTLPGISIEGSLIETYRWDSGSIRASADADLVVTDASGPNFFDANCAGVLNAQ